MEETREIDIRASVEESMEIKVDTIQNSHSTDVMSEARAVIFLVNSDTENLIVTDADG